MLTLDINIPYLPKLIYLIFIMLLNVCLQKGLTLIHDELCIRERSVLNVPLICALINFFSKLVWRVLIFLEGWAETLKVFCLLVHCRAE